MVSSFAERLDAIAIALEEDDDTVDEQGYGALHDEYEQLEAEADALQNAYLPEQAAHAGLVVALAPGGDFRVETGLVRAEDFAALNPPESEAADTAGDEESGDTDPVTSGWIQGPRHPV